MDTLKEKIKDFGLEDKEAEIYLAILQLGKCTITDISSKSAIKRTTIYAYLESLLARGLVFKTIDKKRVYYCPENPENIKAMLEKQKQAIEEKKEKINLIIPELQSFYSGAFHRPQVSFYEGKEGLREVYRKILDTNKIVHSIFSPDNFFKLFSQRENHKLLMTLADKGGILNSLVEKTDQPRNELYRKEYRQFINSRELPDGFHFETDLLVAGDVVALISFNNLIGIIIEDSAIAGLQANFIKTIWKGAHKM